MPKLPLKPVTKMTGGAAGGTGRLEKSAAAPKAGSAKGSLRK